jgi:hypothetical protein
MHPAEIYAVQIAALGPENGLFHSTNTFIQLQCRGLSPINTQSNSIILRGTGTTVAFFAHWL